MKPAAGSSPCGRQYMAVPAGPGASGSCRARGDPAARMGSESPRNVRGDAAAGPPAHGVKPKSPLSAVDIVQACAGLCGDGHSRALGVRRDRQKKPPGAGNGPDAATATALPGWWRWEPCVPDNAEIFLRIGEALERRHLTRRSLMMLHWLPPSGVGNKLQGPRPRIPSRVAGWSPIPPLRAAQRRDPQGAAARDSGVSEAP